MRAFILAAGEGTRLLPLTLRTPKPMLPVAGMPVLEHTIRWLREHGIREIAINLCHRAEAITGYFGDGLRWNVSICYSRENPVLGTAGAIKKLQYWLHETFIVVYGDVLTNMNLERLLTFHREVNAGDGSNSGATLSLYRVPNPAACGIVELRPDGRIVRMVEKPRLDDVFSDLASSGVMIMEPGVHAFLPEHAFCDIGRDLIPRLLSAGSPVYGKVLAADEYLVDMGTMPNYERANREWPRVSNTHGSAPGSGVRC